MQNVGLEARFQSAAMAYRTAWKQGLEGFLSVTLRPLMIGSRPLQRCVVPPFAGWYATGDPSESRRFSFTTATYPPSNRSRRSGGLIFSIALSGVSWGQVPAAGWPSTIPTEQTNKATEQRHIPITSISKYRELITLRVRG